MSSNDSSDAPRGDLPFDLERDVPTTAEDVAFLRRLRQPGESWLPRVNDLNPPSWSPAEASRKTSEGWEPFEL